MKTLSSADRSLVNNVEVAPKPRFSNFVAFWRSTKFTTKFLELELQLTRVACRPTPIHRQDVTIDVRAFRGCQKKHSMCDLFRLAGTTKRDMRQEITHARLKFRILAVKQSASGLG